MIEKFRSEWSAIFEIAYRLIRGRSQKNMGLTTLISISGLILGVACLTVTMAVMSGFQTTLQTALSDTTGHIQIFKFRMSAESIEELQARVRKIVPELQGMTRFLSVEGVLAHQGKVQGVFLQGIDPKEQGHVLNLEPRLISGEFKMENAEIAPALLGKVLAERFQLKPGDKFRLLVPQPSEFDPHEFKRKVGVFQVAGILELGKYEYDERMILLPLEALQKIAEVGTKESGLILKVTDADRAREISTRLGDQLGTGFRVRDWRDINENIFEAVELEKVVLFFVILIIVVASSFNVATSLYVHIVQRYPEIAVLKSMGVSPRKMLVLLSMQGLILGAAGCLGWNCFGGSFGICF
jgi:lipoprotein-releasing system permease protein